jgi:DNA-binding protein Fis
MALRRLDERLLDLLDGTLDPQSEAAAELGLQGEQTVLVMIDVEQGEPADALAAARHLLRTLGALHALSMRGNAIMGLVQAVARGLPGGWPPRLVQALGDAGHVVRLAHEAAKEGLRGLPQQYDAVRETLRIARALRPGDRMLATHETAALVRAMQNLGGVPLAEVCPMILRLHEHDRSPQEPLIRTLLALLETEGNVSLAARTLGIHRHTMLYRIGRISEVPGIEPTPIIRLELRLQLVVWQIANAGR